MVRIGHGLSHISGSGADVDDEYWSNERRRGGVDDCCAPPPPPPPCACCRRGDPRARGCTIALCSTPVLLRRNACHLSYGFLASSSIWCSSSPDVRIPATSAPPRPPFMSEDEEEGHTTDRMGRTSSSTHIHNTRICSAHCGDGDSILVVVSATTFVAFVALILPRQIVPCFLSFFSGREEGLRSHLRFQRVCVCVFVCLCVCACVCPFITSPIILVMMASAFIVLLLHRK